MSARHVALLVYVLAPGLAAAQVSGSIAVLGGSSTDARGIRSNDLTVTPGALILMGARSSAWAGANGTIFENNNWSLGVNSTLATRTPGFGGVALTLRANGGVTATSYQATIATADALPAIEYARGAFSVFGGAHAIVGSTSVSSDQGGIGILPLPRTLQSQTRSSVGPAIGAQLRHVGATAVTIWVLADAARVDSVRVDERSVGLALTRGPASLSGTAGVRNADDERVSFSSGRASYDLSSSLALEISGGTYPSNRYTGAAGGSWMSVGVTVRFGAASSASLPTPTGVGGPANGVTRLSILAPGASRVEIAGDWNDWVPAAVQRAANDVWYADVQLAPGEYRYSFRVDGREWRAPSGAAAVDDGFGGKSAYVIVRGRGSQP